jgi:hypothetical protein
MATKTIKLKGQRITYAGRLRSTSFTGAFQRELRDQGAEFTGTISDKLTLFVEGSRAGAKKIKAITRGATIVSEAQFAQLVEEGELTIETRTGIDRDLDVDEVLGEVRSLLAMPAQNASWSALIEIVDRCDEAQLAGLVHYMSPQIEAWGARKLWSTSPENPIFKAFYPKYWVTGMPHAHLCVAPPLWMLEALRDEPSERHKLARALNLEGMQLNGGLAMRILDHPCWTGIRGLNLGIQNTYSKSFWGDLAAHPMAQGIEELWMDVYPVGIFDGERADTSIFPALKLLRCRFPQVRYRTDSSPEALNYMREESGWIREDVLIKEMSY